jgi:hypothetical protein
MRVWAGFMWLRVDSGRLVNTIMNLQVPWKAGKFFTSWATISFSRRTLLHGITYGNEFMLCWAFNLYRENRQYMQNFVVKPLGKLRIIIKLIFMFVNKLNYSKLMSSGFWN